MYDSHHIIMLLNYILNYTTTNNILNTYFIYKNSIKFFFFLFLKVNFYNANSKIQLSHTSQVEKFQNPQKTIRLNH